MPNQAQVLAKVLKKVTPAPGQARAIQRMTGIVAAKAGQLLSPKKLSYTFAGSYARDTYMLDKKEFDLFILFPEGAPREELERTGLALGKKLATSLKGKWQVAYAEHPYVRAQIGGYQVVIVPAYKVKDAASIKSAVDRTPFHNQWLLGRKFFNSPSN